jgi:hypothetical protein
LISPSTEERMVPAREFPPRSRYVRLLREESVEGRDPVKRFVQRPRYDNLMSPPIEEGIVPTRELP